MICDMRTLAKDVYLRDDYLFISEATDETKILKFDCTSITTGTTRTIAIPNASGTMALTSNITNFQALIGSYYLASCDNADSNMFILGSSFSYEFPMPSNAQLNNFALMSSNIPETEDLYEMKVYVTGGFVQTVTNIAITSTGTAYGALNYALTAGDKVACVIRDLTATRNDEIIIYFYGYKT